METGICERAYARRADGTFYFQSRHGMLDMLSNGVFWSKTSKLRWPIDSSNYLACSSNDSIISIGVAHKNIPWILETQTILGFF